MPETERAGLLIRAEVPGDAQAIRAVTEAAFATVPYADGTEPDIIERLRAKGTLSLSLVAVRDGKLLGQITLSRAIAGDGTPGWYALGPVAVDPAEHGRGIGGALIRAAIAWLEAQRAAGCVLVGHPNYYSRFGFALRPDLAPAGQPAEYYQVLALRGRPTRCLDFDPAFFGP